MRSRTFAISIIGLALGPAPALAARRLSPPNPAATAVVAPGPVHDSVISRPRARAAAIETTTATYRTPDGTPIEVSLSDNYANDPQTVQSFVDFLGGLTHGSELASLHLMILTPAEIAGDCGQDSVACYDPSNDTMEVPGEDTDGSGSLAEAMAHEYGHHIANHRSNAPWSAEDRGPKYWATWGHVCEGVWDHKYFPGDEDKHYWEDPGEAWAQSYAVHEIPGTSYDYVASLTPNAAALAAIGRDVLDPWRGRQTVTFTGSLGAGRRSQRFRLPVHLDGTVTAKLAGPAGSNYDINVIHAGRIQDWTRARGSRDSVTDTVCGGLTVTYSVVRRQGSGPFTLSVATPG